MQLKLSSIEKERDQLKWAQEKSELLNKINECSELIKSKDGELKYKEQQMNERMKDEIASYEEHFNE